MERQLVLFTTPVCVSCRAIKPVLERLAAAHGFTYKTVELDADNQAVFRHFGVRMAPHLALVEGTEPVKSFPGFYGERVLVDRLTEWGVIKGGVEADA